MPFTNEQINHLTAFIGYGSFGAPCCFCGVEEAGGGEANLGMRLDFEPIMDRGAAYQALGIGAEVGTYQPTVTRMSKIALAMITGQNPTQDYTENYQANRLGRAAGSTLMTELWPLPKPGYRAWPPNYTDVFAERGWNSADAYRNAIREERIQILRPVLTNEGRRIIVFYGKSFWGGFSQFLGNGCFEDVAGMPNNIRVTWFSPERLNARRILLVLTNHLSRVTYAQAVGIGQAIHNRHEMTTELGIENWSDSDWLVAPAQG